MIMYFATLLTGLTLITSPVAAETPAFLAPKDAVSAIMDGRPWSATTSGGRQAQITFNKDGTGKFEGPITLSTSWTIKGEDVCLSISIAGTKCLRFRPIADGYEAWQNDRIDLTLRR
jgi:hypothetical protein